MKRSLPLVPVAVSLVIILAALVALFPARLLSPGALMKGHEKLKNECLTCHKPFSGTGRLQCVSCHKPGEIGVRSVAGVPLSKVTSKAGFHRSLAESSCIECHTDHKGSDASKALKTFLHDNLSPSVRNNCNTCHLDRKPADSLHRNYAQGSCAQCHGTTQWKPATFDHKTLSAASGAQCISCHKAAVPKDALHRNANGNCSECHTTTQWKPATYDHDRYFRLDGAHQASCQTCHTDPSDYKRYTCYNCHAHSPSSIAREHQEEGISNYGNCVECHRSGRGEHEGGGEGRGERGDDD